MWNSIKKLFPHAYEDEQIKLLEGLAALWEHNSNLWEENSKVAQELANGWKEQAEKWESIATKLIAERERNNKSVLDS